MTTRDCSWVPSYSEHHSLTVGLTIPRILTPVTGALLHELSSIAVIANSARLIRLRERAA